MKRRTEVNLFEMLETPRTRKSGDGDGSDSRGTSEPASVVADELYGHLRPESREAQAVVPPVSMVFDPVAEAEAAAAAADAREREWRGPSWATWLNREFEVRRATLIVLTTGVGIGLFFAFTIGLGIDRMGRTSSARRSNAEFLAGDPAPWVPDSSVYGLRKAPIREIRAAGATVEEGTSASEPDPPGEGRTPPAHLATGGGWFVVFCTVGNDRAQFLGDLRQHVESLELGPAVTVLDRGAGKSSAAWGPFTSRALAVAFQGQVARRRLPPYRGTPFGERDMLVERIEVGEQP